MWQATALCKFCCSTINPEVDNATWSSQKHVLEYRVKAESWELNNSQCSLARLRAQRVCLSLEDCTAPRTCPILSEMLPSMFLGINSIVDPLRCRPTKNNFKKLGGSSVYPIHRQVQRSFRHSINVYYSWPLKIYHLCPWNTNETIPNFWTIYATLIALKESLICTNKSHHPPIFVQTRQRINWHWLGSNRIQHLHLLQTSVSDYRYKRQVNILKLLPLQQTCWEELQ